MKRKSAKRVYLVYLYDLRCPLAKDKLIDVYDDEEKARRRIKRIEKIGERQLRGRILAMKVS